MHDHAAATAHLHWFAASARKIRRVERLVAVLCTMIRISALTRTDQEVWVSGAVERSPYRLSSHPKVEAFYWTTIMFSQTLGTALGDWMAYADQMA
jgi:uncharacterized membrane-anchored protein